MGPVTDATGRAATEELLDEEAPPPARRHRTRWWVIAAAVVVLAGAGTGAGLALTGGSSKPVGPESVPIQNVPDLASANSTVGGRPVDGITCRPTMLQTEKYHVHVHLDIFVNGVQMRVPAGAGIVAPRIYEPAPGGVFVDNSTSSCLYWLHVHANDGIIHIEAPYAGNFTLGQFFDIWGQPLGPDQVGPARGPVTAFVDGRRFAGNPRNIALRSQSVLQLDVGTPVVPFKPMTFHVTGSCATTCAPPPQG